MSYFECSGCYDEGYGPLYHRGPVPRAPVVYPESEFEGLFEDRVTSIGGSQIVEDDEPVSENGTSTADWGVVLKNCKVISSNESVKIENCTAVERENPYAASPVTRVNRSPMRIMPPMQPVPYYNPAIEYYPAEQRAVRMRRPKEQRPKRRLKKTNKKRPKKVIVEAVV